MPLSTFHCKSTKIQISFIFAKNLIGLQKVKQDEKDIFLSNNSRFNESQY
jgi:hypothetical protein